jgi:hypothetical protein
MDRGAIAIAILIASGCVRPDPDNRRVRFSSNSEMREPRNGRALGPKGVRFRRFRLVRTIRGRYTRRPAAAWHSRAWMGAPDG